MTTLNVAHESCPRSSGIERGGTGIEKGGSGIEKGGSGIEKGGSGITQRAFRRRALFALVFAVVGFGGTGTAVAADGEHFTSFSSWELVGTVDGTAQLQATGPSQAKVSMLINDGQGLNLMLMGSGQLQKSGGYVFSVNEVLSNSELSLKGNGIASGYFGQLLLTVNSCHSVSAELFFDGSDKTASSGSGKTASSGSGKTLGEALVSLGHFEMYALSGNGCAKTASSGSGKTASSGSGKTASSGSGSPAPGDDANGQSEESTNTASSGSGAPAPEGDDSDNGQTTDTASSGSG